MNYTKTSYNHWSLNLAITQVSGGRAISLRLISRSLYTRTPSMCSTIQGNHRASPTREILLGDNIILVNYFQVSIRLLCKQNENSIAVPDRDLRHLYVDFKLHYVTLHCRHLKNIIIIWKTLKCQSRFKWHYLSGHWGRDLPVVLIQ